MIRRMMGAVAAVVALLGGLWLALAPFALGFQLAGDWSRATIVTVASGGGVAVVGIVAFVASVAGLVGDVRRRASGAGVPGVEVARWGVAAAPGAGAAGAVAGNVAVQGFPQGRGYPQAVARGGDEAGVGDRMDPGSPPLGGWGYVRGDVADPTARPGAAGDVGRSTSELADRAPTPDDPPTSADVRTIDLPDLLRVVLPALTRDLDARRRVGESDGEFPRRPTVGVNGRVGPAWSGFLHPVSPSAGADTVPGHLLAEAATMADAVRGRRSANGGDPT
ncbi:MAG TPA: hypothetical protein VGN37_07535 [Actinocatenispora sp.]